MDDTSIIIKGRTVAVLKNERDPPYFLIKFRKGGKITSLPKTRGRKQNGQYEKDGNNNPPSSGEDEGSSKTFSMETSLEDLEMEEIRAERESRKEEANLDSVAILDDDDGPVRKEKKGRKGEIPEEEVVEDYLVCGMDCKEITCPMFFFTLELKKEKAQSEIYTVLKIVRSELPVITKRNLLRMKTVVTKSTDYLSFHDSPSRIITTAFKKIRSGRKLDQKQPISAEDEVLTRDYIIKDIGYIFKNIDKEESFFELVDLIGGESSHQTTEKERDLLDRILKRRGTINADELLLLLDKLLFYSDRALDSLPNICIEYATDFLQDSQMADKFRTMADAAKLHSRLIDGFNKWKSPSLMQKKDEEEWNKRALVYLKEKKDVVVLKSKITGLKLLEKRDIYQKNKEICAMLKRFSLVKVIDIFLDDAGNNPDYCGEIENLLSEERTALLCMMDNRKFYFEDLFEDQYESFIYDMEGGLRSLTPNQKRYKTVIVDRCHTLGIDRLKAVLEMLLSANIKVLHLHGSKKCCSDSIGNPFSDLCYGRTVKTYDIGDNLYSEKNVAGYFYSIEEVVSKLSQDKENSKYPPRLICKDWKKYWEYKRLFEDKEREYKNVKRDKETQLLLDFRFAKLDDVNYSHKSFTVNAIDVTGMNRGDLMKSLHLCLYKEKSIYFIGTKEQVLECQQRKHFVSTSSLSCLAIKDG